MNFHLQKEKFEKRVRGRLWRTWRNLKVDAYPLKNLVSRSDSTLIFVPKWTHKKWQALLLCDTSIPVEPILTFMNDFPRPNDLKSSSNLEETLLAMTHNIWLIKKFITNNDRCWIACWGIFAAFQSPNRPFLRTVCRYFSHLLKVRGVIVDWQETYYSVALDTALLKKHEHRYPYEF